MWSLTTVCRVVLLTPQLLTPWTPVRCDNDDGDGGVSPSPANPAKKLINIDYIGLGYDAYKGNPQSALYDPGFRESIIKLSYDNQTITADGMWLVPDNVQAIQTYSCSYETDSTEVTGEESYQDSLSVDASIEIGGFGQKFSASVQYNEVSEGTSKRHSVYLSSVARCIHYEAMVHSMDRIQLSAAFRDNVKHLPETMDTLEEKQMYLDFIRSFGTHYASVVVMGAKAIIRSEFSQTAYSSLQQSSVNVQAAAQASYAVVTGKIESSVGKAAQDKKAFEEKRSSVKELYVGSQPSKDGDWRTWAAATYKNPYPVQYTLRELTDLLTIEHFPDSSSSVIKKQKNLDRANAFYCSRLPKCKPPQNDFAIPKMISVEGSAVRYGAIQEVVCRPGYALLSCGKAFGGSSLSDTKESSGFVIAKDYMTCYTMACCDLSATAWCANNRVMESKKFTIVTADKNDQVSCPGNRKVLGCHAGIHFISNLLQSYRPKLDASGCICNKGINKCQATCADGIKDHEIHYKYRDQGSVAVNVTCSPDNFALGCGFETSKLPSRGIAFAYVNTISSCQCYSSAAFTCYVICGRLD